MPNQVLKCDCSGGDSFVLRQIQGTSLGSVTPPYAISLDLYIPTSTFTAITADDFSADFIQFTSSSPTGGDGIFLTGYDTGGGAHPFSSGNRNWWTDNTPNNPKATPAFSENTWLRNLRVDINGTTVVWSLGGVTIDSFSQNNGQLDLISAGGIASNATSGEVYYIDNFKILAGSTVVFSDDFEGSGTVGSEFPNIWTPPNPSSTTPVNFWTEKFDSPTIFSDPHPAVGIHFSQRF